MRWLIRRRRRSEFFKAIYDRNIPRTRQLLQLDRSLIRERDKSSSEQWIPLMWACQKGSLEIARLLIDAGADLNQRSTQPHGFTPLMQATLFQRPQIVQLLLESGADVNIKSKSGSTPLLIAVKWNNVHLTRILLRHGAKTKIHDHYGFTPLLWAVLNEDEPMINLLLDFKANIHCSSHLSSWFTPLFCACQRNLVAIVDLLLQRGADPNTTPNQRNAGIGCTPLSTACKQGHLHVVEVLIAHGAHADLPHPSAFLPIMQAVGHEDILALLLCHGADANQTNTRGGTAVSLAVELGILPSLKLLLQHGANVLAVNSHGLSAFALACETQQLDMIYTIIRSTPSLWLR